MTLSDDTVCLIGLNQSNRPEGPHKHMVWSFTEEELRDECYLCGFRADWVILLKPFEQEFIDTIIKPFLCASYKTERPIPVIWTASKERIFPHI